MSVLAIAIKHLVALGMSGDELAATIIEMENAQDNRSAGAKRQERYRRHKASQSVTCDADVTSPPISLPHNENISNPPTHTPPDITTRTRKAARLPVDWLPSPLPSKAQDEFATCNPGAIERELSKFKDWAASAPGQKGVKQDWDATWRNWLRRANEDGRLGRNNGNATPSKTGSVTERAMQRAAERLGVEGPGFGNQGGTGNALPSDDRVGSLPHARRSIGNDGGRQSQLAYRGSDGG